MALAPGVTSRLSSGRFRRRDLIRVDLPGLTVGYHGGGRDYTYNGILYRANKYLSFGSANHAIGPSTTAREVVFSNVPTGDPQDAIGSIEQYDYLNAPVILTHLIGDPEADEVVGVLASSFYKIEKISYVEGAMGEDGVLPMTVRVRLQPLGRVQRGSTGVKRSPEEQKVHWSATDTGLDFVAKVRNVPMEWGKEGGG